MKFQFIRKIKIWHRMIVLIQVMSIPTIIIFIMFLYTINKLYQIENRILMENVSSIRAAYNIEISLLKLKGQKANYILEGSTKWLEDFSNDADQFDFWYDKAFKAAKSDDELNILSTISLDFEQYLKFHDEIIELMDKGKKKEAIKVLHSKSTSYYDELYKGSENLIKKNEKIINESNEKAKQYLERSRIFGYITIVCFILMGIGFSLIITKSIVDPIKEMELDSSSVANITSDKNEIEGLRERFSKMIKTIEDNQEKLIHSERKAAIGEIAAGISHELNNPIGIICGFSEMMIKRESLSKKDRETVEDIYQEAVRCKNLLGRLLNFARTPEPNIKLTGIKNLIKQTVKTFENQEKYSLVKFSISIPKEPVKIYIDSVQMRQVFINLILNACDAMNNSGKIIITLNVDDKNSVLSFKDNGSGITPENQEKIFTPFYSSKPKGVGLGLAICRDIVEQHNGRLTVESDAGSFSNFIITIPRGKNG